MASTRRIVKLIISSSPIRSHRSPFPSFNFRSIATLSNVNCDNNSSGGSWGRRTSKDYFRLNFSLPAAAALAGSTGFGLFEIARADAASDEFPLPPSESSSSYADLEEIARKERERLEDLLKGKGMNYGSYPRFTVAVKGQKIDGFEQDKKVVVIAATNRKHYLDPALISRFDSMITFGLPDDHNRQKIAAQYAKHLTKSELAEFASVTEEMSGRDIRDVCQQAERHWASKIIRGQVARESEEEGRLPPLQEYIYSAVERKKALVSIEDQKAQDAQNRSKKPQLDLS